MGTAEKTAADLDAVPDHLAPAMLTDGRHPVDRALKAVEHVNGALRMNLKGQVVVVAAHLALRHLPTLLHFEWSG